MQSSSHKGDDTDNKLGHGRREKSRRCSLLLSIKHPNVKNYCERKFSSSQSLCMRLVRFRELNWLVADSLESRTIIIDGLLLVVVWSSSRSCNSRTSQILFIPFCCCYLSSSTYVFKILPRRPCLMNKLFCKTLALDLSLSLSTSSRTSACSFVTKTLFGPQFS